jgi:hypothetical protein
VRQDGQALGLHLPDVSGGTGIALDGAALIGLPGLFDRQARSSLPA